MLNLTIDARFKFDDRDRLKVRVLDPLAPGWRVLDLLPSLIGYRIRKAERVLSRIWDDHRDVHYFQKAADAFRLRINPAEGWEARVPQFGPLVVLANHPLNGIDGMAIAAALCRRRPDLKIMLTTTFDGIPGIEDHAIFVNASDGPSARNRSEPVREAIAWLKEGHALLLFPAGQGSYVVEKGRREPVDSTWSTGVTTLISKSRANVLPVFVKGEPSRVFLVTRRLHQVLSTLFLLREILVQEGTEVQFTVGDAISSKELAAQGGRREQAAYLRQVTYALRDAGDDAESEG